MKSSHLVVEGVAAGNFVEEAVHSYTAAAEEASAGSRCHTVVVEGHRSRCTAAVERETDMV